MKDATSPLMFAVSRCSKLLQTWNKQNVLQHSSRQVGTCHVGRSLVVLATGPRGIHFAPHMCSRTSGAVVLLVSEKLEQNFQDTKPSHQSRTRFDIGRCVFCYFQIVAGDISDLRVTAIHHEFPRARALQEREKPKLGAFGTKLNQI